jgi:signal transduction histidine kinase/CheY-like chemotaxis protein
MIIFQKKSRGAMFYIKKKFSNKITFYFFCFIAIGIAGFILLFLNLQKKIQALETNQNFIARIARIETQEHFITNAIKVVMNDIVDNNFIERNLSYSALHSAISHIFHDQFYRIGYIVLLDETGAIYQNSAFPSNNFIADLEVVRDYAPNIYEVTYLTQKRFLEVKKKINIRQDNNIIVLNMRLGFPCDTIEERLHINKQFNVDYWDIYFNMGIFLFFTFITTLLISSILSKKIIAPLNTLGAAALEISNVLQCKYKDIHAIQLITVDTEDEISYLFKQFKSMLDTIKELYHEKEEYSLGLEDKIHFHIKALQAENYNKEKFIAEVSHEIRTPLNTIISTAYLLRRHTEHLSGDQKNWIRYILTASEALARIINNILEISKIDSGTFQVKKESFNMEELINKVIDTMTYAAHKKSIQFHAWVDPFIPILLRGDNTSLLQVLVNLGNNAIKHTSIGSVKLNISLQQRMMDKVLLKFSVVDTGVGILEKEKNKIFSVYGQGENNQEEGYGLGLALSKKMVEMMGGNIDFTSIHITEDPSKHGSVFFFELWIDFENKLNKEQHGIKFLEIKSNILMYVNKIGIYNFNQLKETIDLLGSHIEQTADYQRVIHEINREAYKILLVDQVAPNLDEIQKILKDKQLNGIAVPKVIYIGEKTCFEKNILSGSFDQSEILHMIKTIMGTPILFSPDLIQDISKRLSGSKVLIVDDIQSNILALQGLFNDVKINYHSANTGEDAIRIVSELQKEKIELDLILMDLQMSPMDGFQTTQILRKQGIKTPIVALTAMENNQENINRSIVVGMDGYLTKPLILEKVKETFERYICHKKTIRLVYNRFLIVDDDYTSRMVFKEWIKQITSLICVDETDNPDIALKLINEKKYDIVFTDINLSNVINGWELCHRINRLQKPPMVIGISGSEEKEENLQMVKMTAYLKKPYSFSDLYRVLNRYIDLSLDPDDTFTQISHIQQVLNVVQSEVNGELEKKCGDKEMSEIAHILNNINHTLTRIDQKIALLIGSQQTMAKPLGGVLPIRFF